MIRALCLILLPSALNAQAVEAVPYSTLETQLAARVDFETFPKHLSPGLPLEGVYDFEGVSLAERFLGQGLRQEDGFDRLTLSPVAPLRLVPGAEGQNLAVAHIFFLTNQIKGIAPPGFPAQEAGGEGAIAILFDHDQFAVGFRVAAEPTPDEDLANKGWMRVSFYRRDGSLIALAQVALDWGRKGYGFMRAAKVRDIAGITIENHDPAGIAIDDILFDVREPTS